MSRHFILGITGSVAAYKSIELIRLLRTKGDTVEAALTKAGEQFVTSVMLQALTEREVRTSLWQDGMAHISCERKATAIIIAPASADFIAKLAHGLADDFLSTLCLARTCPLFVVPAMNQAMWNNPATQRNIAQLKQDGIQVLGPSYGIQACGESGWGRLLEVEMLIQEIEAYFEPKILLGKKVLVTVGATQEKLDPVRVLSNLSSGKMGLAIAQMAYAMGAEVTLVRGVTHTQAALQAQIRQYAVTSAQEMYQCVMQHINEQDIFISVAAVADYRPETPATDKLKKQGSDRLSLNLVKNPDILCDVAGLPRAPFCVGFSAETSNMLEHAEQKRRAKKIPLMVANDAQSTLAADTAEVTLLDDSGQRLLARAPKQEIARGILQYVGERLGS